ncbi:MAG TPA: hypothetical protein VLV83_02230 [Acidobacteriota bacterium]|nr:hypothetical protein [Acidobacteriota bacterium]
MEVIEQHGIIGQAVKLALELLLQTPCGNFFGGPPARTDLYNLLRTGRIRFEELERPFLEDGVFPNVMWATNNPFVEAPEGDLFGGGEILINTLGPFSTDDGVIEIDGSKHDILRIEGFGLTMEQRRAVTVLHEFGHLRNKIPDDATRGSKQNSQDIIDACFSNED